MREDATGGKHQGKYGEKFRRRPMEPFPAMESPEAAQPIRWNSTMFWRGHKNLPQERLLQSVWASSPKLILTANAPWVRMNQNWLLHAIVFSHPFHFIQAHRMFTSAGCCQGVSLELWIRVNIPETGSLNLHCDAFNHLWFMIITSLNLI